MYLQLIGITFLLCTCSITGFQEFDSEKCRTYDVGNCSQTKLCEEDERHQIYPGRIKILPLNLYIPQGITKGAYIRLTTDGSVILSDAYLTFQDDITTTTKKKNSSRTATSGRTKVTLKAEYILEEIHCNGNRNFISTATMSPTETLNNFESTEIFNNTESTESTSSSATTETLNRTDTTESPNSTASTESLNNTASTDTLNNTATRDSLNSTATTETLNDTTSATSLVNTDSTQSPVNTETTESKFTVENPCYYCLLQVSVELLMANITGLPDMSTTTINATFNWNTGGLSVTPILVLNLFQNSSKEANFSTDLMDEVEVPRSSASTFKLHAILSNPLSTYKLVFFSPDKDLRIVSVRIRSVGDHHKEIISTENSYEHDEEFCYEGPDTRVIDFGYLPNIGAYDDNASPIADTVVFEVILLMSEEAITGKAYPLVLYLEVDFVVTQNTTKYIKASARIPMKKLVVKHNQGLSSLPVGGTSSASLTVNIPPLSSGIYQITTSSKNNGSGLDIAGISVDQGDHYFPCVHRYWKERSSCSLNILNIPNISGSISEEKQFGFKISVFAYPESVKELSTYKLAVNLTYPGEGSPQEFEFFFNITGEKIRARPEPHVTSVCYSSTLTTDVLLSIITEHGQAYGRLNIEIPDSSIPMEESMALCGPPSVTTGINIFGRFNISVIRGTSKMIEKSFVEISSLANVILEPNMTFGPYRLDIGMAFTFINTTRSIYWTSPGELPIRITRENDLIWASKLLFFKPVIEHFPDFIVIKGFWTFSNRTPEHNVSFHYSRNGSYFYTKTIVCYDYRDTCWPERIIIISHYYVSTVPCKALCGLEVNWSHLYYYITIVSDNNNTILRMMHYALDQDLDTCFDLPVTGNSPSMFWLRIKDLSLFNVNVSSIQFLVHITGKGIKCERLGLKSMLVGTSGPTYNGQCNMESDVTFCNLVSEHSNATFTKCSMGCKCDDINQCSNVHIIMQSTNKDVWTLCEIAISNEE